MNTTGSAISRGLRAGVSRRASAAGSASAGDLRSGSSPGGLIGTRYFSRGFTAAFAALGLMLVDHSPPSVRCRSSRPIWSRRCAIAIRWLNAQPIQPFAREATHRSGALGRLAARTLTLTLQLLRGTLLQPLRGTLLQPLRGTAHVSVIADRRGAPSATCCFNASSLDRTNRGLAKRKIVGAGGGVLFQ
jgi:hypothetical protein